MSAAVPPLAFFCLLVLAPFSDQLHHHRPHRVPAHPALLDALSHSRDPRLWATLAQLVHSLPPHLHDRDLPLSHPDLPLLQRIPDSPDFSLVTLVSLPNCVHLRDDCVTSLRALHRLLALDLRGCSISSYALTTLARGLNSSDGTRTGTWCLRLLSLHGCPNIDDDALPALQKFPLLSAVDLRFTRCNPSTVNACLSSLGFRPSGQSSLFHPAPLPLALCTLEKLAHTTSTPISLYSCPPQSIFRIHIDTLDHLSSHPKKGAFVDNSNKSRTTMEDVVVFVPPPRKLVKNTPSKRSAPAAVVPAAPVSPSVDKPTHSSLDSNVSSFYASAPTHKRHSRTSILPLSAQAVRSPEDGRLDSLALARSPPPWKALSNHGSPTDPYTTDNTDDSRRKQPIARWIGRALDSSLKVDHARLRKRGSDTIADMVRQLTSKKPKVESEFVLARTRGTVFAKSRNPFARSMFVESSTQTSNDSLASVRVTSTATEPGMHLRVCRSLPSEKVRPQGTEVKETLRPLKPITALKPPILAKESLPCPPGHVSHPKRSLKQTQLSFSREDGR